MTFALRGGRSGPVGGSTGAVPVRATLAVAVLGLCGVVAVATFAASLDRLGETPARYGWAGRLRDHRLASRSTSRTWPPTRGSPRWSTARRAPVQHRRPAGAGHRPRGRCKGETPLTVLAGRLPRRDDEVALGSREADRLGATVGSTVALDDVRPGRCRGRRTLRVVGLVITPPVSEGLRRRRVPHRRARRSGRGSVDGVHDGVRRRGAGGRRAGDVRRAGAAARDDPARRGRRRCATWSTSAGCRRCWPRSSPCWPSRCSRTRWC